VQSTGENESQGEEHDGCEDELYEELGGGSQIAYLADSVPHTTYSSVVEAWVEAMSEQDGDESDM
jgi:hypothetical protein